MGPIRVTCTPFLSQKSPFDSIDLTTLESKFPIYKARECLAIISSIQLFIYTAANLSGTL